MWSFRQPTRRAGGRPDEAAAEEGGEPPAGFFQAREAGIWLGCGMGWCEWDVGGDGLVGASTTEREGADVHVRRPSKSGGGACCPLGLTPAAAAPPRLAAPPLTAAPAPVVSPSLCSLLPPLSLPLPLFLPLPPPPPLPPLRGFLLSCIEMLSTGGGRLAPVSTRQYSSSSSSSKRTSGRQKGCSRHRRGRRLGRRA